jgi:hypothetical protein
LRRRTYPSSGLGLDSSIQGFELDRGLLADHRVEAIDEGSGIRQHRNALFDGGDSALVK